MVTDLPVESRGVQSAPTAERRDMCRRAQRLSLVPAANEVDAPLGRKFRPKVTLRREGNRNMTSTPTDAVQRQSLRSNARRQLRRTAKWACAAGLLIAQTAALADEGTKTNTVRIIAVQPSAGASEAGVAPAQPEPEDVPSVLQPSAKGPAEKPQADATAAVNAVPYEIQPIGRLGANISTPREILQRGEHPDKNYDYAAKVFANRPTVDARGMSGWQPLSYTSYGPGAVVCFHPAYFAQTSVERYGLAHRLQPVWSGAQFYGTALALPALWMIRHPWNHICRGPECQPAGLDATAEFFQPTVVCREGSEAAPEMP